MLLGLTLITFVLTYVVPGDPVDLITRSAGGPAPSAGTDVPLPVQYVRYLWRLLQGDLGRSYVTNQRVIDGIARAFPLTVRLPSTRRPSAFTFRRPSTCWQAPPTHFRIVGQSTGTYPGTMALLSQSLQARESAEAAWVAEVEKLSGTGEVAGTGAPATAPTVIKELGTRGMRPEEEASQLLERALTHAVQALSAAQVAPQRAIFGEEVAEKFASDEASAIMEGVVHLLESALKIVQIAIDR